MCGSMGDICFGALTLIRGSSQRGCSFLCRFRLRGGGTFGDLCARLVLSRSVRLRLGWRHSCLRRGRGRQGEARDLGVGVGVLHAQPQVAPQHGHRVHVEPAPAGGSAQIVIDEATFTIPLEDAIDVRAERARLAKALTAAEKERDALAKRLGSPGFAEKAKPEAIDKARADHAERSAEAERVGAALARLG